MMELTNKYKNILDFQSKNKATLTYEDSYFIIILFVFAKNMNKFPS